LFGHGGDSGGGDAGLLRGHGGGAGEGGGDGAGVAVAVGGQDVEVVVAAGHQGGGERDHHAAGRASSTQDCVDQGPADAAVAVGERVDGLELGVCDGGLG